MKDRRREPMSHRNERSSQYRSVRNSSSRRAAHRRRKRRVRINYTRLLVSSLVMLFVLVVLIKGIASGVGAIKTAFSSDGDKPSSTLASQETTSSSEHTEVNKPQKIENSKGTDTEPLASGAKQARIIATGDLLYHMNMIENAYDEATETYNFDSNYEKIKDYIASADLALGNFEGTMAEDFFPISGYPIFNAPKEVATALGHAGFDGLATANNHALDSHQDGVKSTIDAIEKAGMFHFGTKKAPGSSVVLQEVNGIKIAFMAYSYGFNDMDTLLTEEEKTYMVNYIDREQIKSDVAEAEGAGADLVMVYMHWGKEYTIHQNEEQTVLADQLLEDGVDVVFGSHPHVLQGTKTVGEGRDKKFIVYSMGNSISNQDRYTVEDKYTETGAFMQIDVAKDEQGAFIESIEMLPTWVHKFEKNGKLYHQLLLTRDYIEGGEKREELNQEEKDKIDDAHRYALEILNNQKTEE